MADLTPKTPALPNESKHSSEKQIVFDFNSVNVQERIKHHQSENCTCSCTFIGRVLSPIQAEVCGVGRWSRGQKSQHYVSDLSEQTRLTWGERAEAHEVFINLWLGCLLCNCSSFSLSASDPPQSVVSELSHDSLHTSQAVCDSVSFEDSCARWDQLGEALWVDWTLALAQHAIQQEEEQMAPIMYHQTSLQSWLFISNMSRSLFFTSLQMLVMYGFQVLPAVFLTAARTHILAYLLKICSVSYLCTIRTSPQDKYLVSACRAGLLRCSLMSVSRSIQSQVFSVHGALLTWNSSAYAGKHSHGSQNKLCRSRQTRRSVQIVQQVTPGSLPCKCTHWLQSLLVLQ